MTPVVTQFVTALAPEQHLVLLAPWHLAAARLNVPHEAPVWTQPLGCVAAALLAIRVTNTGVAQATVAAR